MSLLNNEMCINHVLTCYLLQYRPAVRTAGSSDHWGSVGVYGASKGASDRASWLAC